MGLIYGIEGYNYVSENGITYDLLEGKTIGSVKSYTSNYVFILLDLMVYDLDKEMTDEFFKLSDSSSIFVDHMQMAGDETYCGLVEEDIKKSVDKFERKHKELIEFIINNKLIQY